MKPAAVRWMAWVGSYIAVVAVALAFGRHVPIPNEGYGMSPDGGGLSVAAQQLLGRPVESDFLVDYASAAALIHDRDAYGVSETLIADVGMRWPVLHANPHPPTLLPLLIPFTALPYEKALAAWTLAMVACFVATLALMSIPIRYAISIAVGLCLVFPGAYAIGNPVPLIGLGVAVAFRHRDTPHLAAIGLALATAPKISGALLAIPFLLTSRIKALAYAALLIVLMAAIPTLLEPMVWERYLDAGTEAGRLNAARPDNASLLNLADKFGLPAALALAPLALVAIVFALARNDLYWPTVWLTVAALPIAWMYSLLTLAPLAVWAVGRAKSAARLLLLAMVTLTVACRPFGIWPTRVFPIVVALAYALLWIAAPREPSGFDRAQGSFLARRAVKLQR